jgi:hypothetical protein
VKGDLHKGIAIQEFDESVAALKTASACCSGAFGYRVLNWSISANFLVKVFKDDDDEPDNSKKERSECQAAKVVSEDPPNALEETRLTPSVTA